MKNPPTQLDFFNTFYADESGRKVFAWMHDVADSIAIDSDSTAVGVCMIRNILNEIKLGAGVNNQAVIAAEAIAAMPDDDKKPEPKKDLLET